MYNIYITGDDQYLKACSFTPNSDGPNFLYLNKKFKKKLLKKL